MQFDRIFYIESSHSNLSLLKMILFSHKVWEHNGITALQTFSYINVYQCDNKYTSSPAWA